AGSDRREPLRRARTRGAGGRVAGAAVQRCVQDLSVGPGRNGGAPRARLPDRAQRARRRARPVRVRQGHDAGAPRGARPAPRRATGALSGGEEERAPIGAAAARRAPLVLADEPTGELDAGNERLVLDALRELRGSFGGTVVAVTHSQRVARAADRVIEMRDG